jgi:hypothetical protein
MSPSQRDANSGRVRDEVLARLHALGVETARHDSPEELVRLLEAVEEFEQTVERAGGDLMVDEPVGNNAPTNPDDRSFVLPTRENNEPIAAFIARIAVARDRASHARSKMPGQ